MKTHHPPADPTWRARHQAHRALDRLWHSARPVMTREQAYLWLSNRLGIESRRAHISQLSARECGLLVALIGRDFPT